MDNSPHDLDQEIAEVAANEAISETQPSNEELISEVSHLGQLGLKFDAFKSRLLLTTIDYFNALGQAYVDKNSPAKPELEKHLLAEEAIVVQVAALEEEAYVEHLERDHYAREAPLFSDQVNEVDRANDFAYVDTDYAKHGQPPHGKENTIRMTEHQGLQGLQRFLQKAAGSITHGTLKRRAEGMLEDLTFIGRKEYVEAAHGIAVYWKQYLDANPDHQICILTEISSNGGSNKSDRYLLEQILSFFTEEEVDHYKYRMTTELEDITSDPEDVKIIMLDDWTISGSQLKDAYRTISDFEKHDYVGCVEMDLITATAERIKKGFLHDNWTYTTSDDFYIPVYAYFKAHDAKTANYGACITGTHSSVDYDFENVIGDMVDRLNDNHHVGGKFTMPPLTNVLRVYRVMDMPLTTEMAEARIRRKRADQTTENRAS